MITPLDIQNKEFSRAVRGYNQEEVDLFLDEIMADYDDVARGREERLAAERAKEQALNDERRFDKERIAAEKRLRK